MSLRMGIVMIVGASVTGCAVAGDATEAVAMASNADPSCFSVARVTHDLVDGEDVVVLNHRTTFYVEGTGLPDTTAFYLDQCKEVERGGISSDRTIASFSCTPSYSAGLKSGVVKPYSGAPIQFTFQVNVEDRD